MATMYLKNIVKRSKKRLGRGHGSGKVKTSGRGTKGQNARDHARLGFEGGQLALIKRLPFLRGKKRNECRGVTVTAVPLEKLEKLPKGSIVDLPSLIKHGIVSSRTKAVKLLGSASLSSAFTVHVPCSQTSQQAIEKAGGKLDLAKQS